MEKRLLGLLFVIGLVVYVIYQILPFLLGCAASVVFVALVVNLYKKFTEEYAHCGRYLFTPLLIIGWMYIGYLCYANFYCNTYIIGYQYSDYKVQSIKPYKIIAKSDEDVIVQAWNNFLKEHKQSFDSIDYYGSKPLYTIYIYNQSHDKLISVYKYQSFIEEKKLQYNNGKITFDFYDFFRGW